MNEPRNQSKITSLFKPIQNSKKPESKIVSEPPQHRQTIDPAGKRSDTLIAQDNLSVGESSQGLGYTCTSPDLARKHSFQTKPENPSNENDISGISSTKA